MNHSNDILMKLMSGVQTVLVQRELSGPCMKTSVPNFFCVVLSNYFFAVIYRNRNLSEDSRRSTPLQLSPLESSAAVTEVFSGDIESWRKVWEYGRLLWKFFSLIYGTTRCFWRLNARWFIFSLDFRLGTCHVAHAFPKIISRTTIQFRRFLPKFPRLGTLFTTCFKSAETSLFDI